MEAFRDKWYVTSAAGDGENVAYMGYVLTEATRAVTAGLMATRDNAANMALCNSM